MTHRHPSLFWPILLIGVGVIFLLNNAGLIQGSPWAVIWRFWPVLLIVIGLDILFGRRSAAGSIISAALALLLVGGVIWLLVARPNLPGLNFGGALTTDRVEYPLKEIRSANVTLSFSTGTNKLYALSDSSNLIEGDLRHYGTLLTEFSESGSQADLEIGVSDSTVFGFGADERWNIGLNPRVTYTLDLSLGVGRSTIDLGELTLSGGRIDVGVGSTEVRLPASGRFTLSVDGGVGELRIIAPRGVALRAEVDTGVGNFNAGSRLRSVGDDVYETEGFASAENAMTLIVNVGVGAVKIQDE
ncbi:MAG: LiaF transmembrane domain-containing protein [Anaerolineae bacterium]